MTPPPAIATSPLPIVALQNDGTVVAWGDNTYGQTNVPLYLAGVKLIAAGGDHTLASEFSTLLQYPVDVTKDLLLIYNTNSLDSSNVCAYYLAHRPMVSAANVLGIGNPTAYGAPTNETALPGEFTTNIAGPVISWLNTNPTKRPQYVVLFPDIPSRVNGFNGVDTNGFRYYMDQTYVHPSVSIQLRSVATGWVPFVTHLNMGDTNACRAYIDKLAWCGSNYSPGKMILSASAGTYANTNYIVDDVRHDSYLGSVVYPATNGLLEAQVPWASISYIVALEPCSQSVTNVINAQTNVTCVAWSGLPHITNAVDPAGYICWGFHSSLGSFYATNVHWSGASRWWVIETVESFSGQRYGDGGNFLQWFAATAFGGTNYENTPVGAVTYVDEPHLGGISSASSYFALWASGKSLGMAAWNSTNTYYFQAVGDPLVKK